MDVRYEPMWVGLHSEFKPDMLGYLPSFLDFRDVAPANQQINKHYQHGGGWRKFDGFRFDQHRLTLSYPGDPPLQALATTMLRDETIYLFEASWVVIVQKDGSWETARVD